MDKKEKRRIIFFGTPVFAKIILEKLAACSHNEIVGVVTKPDARAGRKMAIVESEVKKFARQNNWLLFQPDKVRDEDFINSLRELRPDFIVTAAYGKILPKEILDLPKYESLNVHGSFLPHYRGAAPIQRSIMDAWKGNGYTGVSIMRMVEAMDAGPVYAQSRIPILNKNSRQLAEEMAEKGAELLQKALHGIQANELQALEQNESEATFAPKIQKTEAVFAADASVYQLLYLIQAFSPKPGLNIDFKFTGLDKIINAKIVQAEARPARSDLPNGTLIKESGELLIKCPDGFLNILTLVPNSRKEMSMADFFKGKPQIQNGVCGFAD